MIVTGLVSLRLSSPSLSCLMLWLPRLDLKIYFDLSLETLNVQCSQLSFEGDGSVDSLGLNIGFIKKSVSS